jgi:catechol 2,3-dioxygenase-like lactoylglutathione lyase family enzyme
VLLNHVDLQVPDVQLTAAFFEAHFGFTRLGNQRSPAIAILEGPGPFTLVLQHDAAPRYPEGFHIGFIVETLELVHAQHARMAGVERVGRVQVNGRGTMFYARAPGEVTVEVSCRRER